MSDLTPSITFGRCCDIAAVAILAYDILLTSSREVDCVWGRKFSVASVLYVTQRYSAFLSFTLPQSSPTSLQECQAQIITQYLLFLLDMFGGAAFTTLRAWAVSGRINILVVLTFLFSMFAPCINLYNIAAAQIFYDPTDGCYYSSPPPPGKPEFIPVFTRTTAVVADLVVLMITWTKTADAMRLRDEHFRPKLSTLLLRNGMAYFAVLCTLNVVNVILDVLTIGFNFNGSSNFVNVNEAVASALIARFILDLRSVSDPNESRGQLSTVRFTPSFSGNIGGSLGVAESTWMSGAADDIDDNYVQDHDRTEYEDSQDVGLRDFDGERNRRLSEAGPSA